VIFSLGEGLSENKKGQKEEFSLLSCEVTPSGFLIYIDIQLVEYFVDRFVDLKAKSSVNFVRFYSGKSVFIKVREKFSGDLKNSDLKANEIV